MLRTLTLFITCSFFTVSLNALAKENFFVVVKGGISLGSYESGINWALLDYIHNTQDKNSLTSFSGASAGSINSILSAIEYCQSRTAGNPVNNIFFSSWDIDLSKLLDDGAAKDALFSRDALDEKVRALERKLDLGASKPCDITITMSVTRFKPHRRPFINTGHEITLQRFVVPLRVVADGDKKPIRFENVYDKSKIRLDRIPSAYIHLPENQSDKSIPFARIKEVAYASSAFPVAFSPRELTYCLSTKANLEHPCVDSGDNQSNPVESAKFSDGGLFDNSPIGVAIDIEKKRLVFSDAQEKSNQILDSQNHETSNTILYINPDNYRPELQKSPCKNAEEAPPSDKIDNAGFVEYGEYIYQSFANATSFELQKALADIENDTSSNLRLLTTSRFHHLLADFHAHFGAFYSSDFRLHDYIVGVYDGLRVVAAISCGGVNASRDCIGEKLLSSINHLFNGNQLKDDNTLYFNFMKYLYNEEYPHEKIDITDNQLVALNLAFKKTVKSSSKDSCEEVSLPAYLRNLEELKDSAQFRHAVFTPDSDSLISDYNSWQANKLTYAVENITTMQECEKCDHANKSIGDAIKSSQSIIEAILVHMDEGIWPQSWDPVKKWKSTLGVYLGYDSKEVANDIGIKLRIPFSHYKSSIDTSIDWHYLSARGEYDHYWSASAALVYHSQSGNSLIFPTIGLGMEYSLPSTLYNSSDKAYFFSAGLFSEILNIKLSHRYNDVANNQSMLIRSDNQILISLELVKLFRIATKR